MISGPRDHRDKATAGIDAAIARTRRQIELGARVPHPAHRRRGDGQAGRTRGGGAAAGRRPTSQEPVDEGDPTDDVDGALEEADDAAEEAMV